nr:stress-response A/B barrel domain-containing protein UP3-like [Ipomoea trifida]
MISSMRAVAGGRHILAPSSYSHSPAGGATTAASTATFRRRFSASAIKMSAGQIVEHVVLFKVKPDVEPLKINEMVGNLNGLSSMPQVLHLTAGAVVQTRSSSFAFTHMLHSRYASKSDLADYSAHPDHMGVVRANVLPICDDIMAVDWVADDLIGPVKVPPGSVFRVTFLKLKEDLGENEKNEILTVTKGIKEKFPSINQLSVGENFSPARAKGFSIASIAVFGGAKELEALESQSAAANEQKDKVRQFLDGVLVVDYAVPALHTANL